MESPDLMESKDLKEGPVRRGNRAPLESRDQRATLGLQEARASRDRRESEVVLVLLAKMVLKGKMEPRANLVILGQWANRGTKG